MRGGVPFERRGVSFAASDWSDDVNDPTASLERRIALPFGEAGPPGGIASVAMTPGQEQWPGEGVQTRARASQPA